MSLVPAPHIIHSMGHCVGTSSPSGACSGKSTLHGSVVSASLWETIFNSGLWSETSFQSVCSQHPSLLQLLLPLSYEAFPPVSNVNGMYHWFVWNTPAHLRGNSPGHIAEERHLRKDNCSPLFGYQTVETMHLEKLKFPSLRLEKRKGCDPGAHQKGCLSPWNRVLVQTIQFVRPQCRTRAEAVMGQWWAWPRLDRNA